MGRTERLAQPEDFGKYQLIARLAHGRMGDVYKAKSHGVEGFEKILVVKVLNPGLVGVPSFVDTVVDEAKRSVALSHANVVQVYDLGRTDEGDQFYIATEFVNGFDLARAMKLARRSEHDWPQDLSVFIASEVAKGLDYAHRRKDFNFNNLNILHCDLSPHNVMISYDGEVKITDFGISSAMDLVPPIDDSDTMRRYRYVAPEVARGGEHTRQSDIFSLGMIIYEMLAGAPPYDTDDAAELEKRAKQGQIRPISEHVQVPRQLQQILESMLVPDPAGRATSAGQIYEELIGYLFGNNLRADSRSLGHFVQELRREEQRISPQDATQEVGLDEISITELTGVLTDSSIVDQFVEDADKVGPALPQVSSPTHSDLPSAKIQQMLADKQGDDSPPLPGTLREHFLSARAGRGKAVLASGQFGSGREYLSDRLVDALGWRGNTQAFGIQTTDDDVYRPFGVLSDLILRCLHETVAGTNDHRHAALQVLGQLDGVSDKAVATLGALWDMQEMPRLGYDERRDDFTSLFLALLRDFCRTGPVVLVIDRVERIDSLTLDVLRDVVAHIGSMSVMLVMITRADELMRSAFDVGQPEDLEAIRVVGGSTPELSALDDLPDDAADILMMLAIAGQPMSQADLSQVLALPGDRLMESLRDLTDRGAVRIPRTGIFLAGSSDLSVWVEQRFSRTDVEQAARSLARYYKHRVVRGDIDRLTPSLLRLYALAGDRRRMLSLAEAYSRWLEREGWLGVALDFYGHVADLLAQHSLGSPQARIGYILSRAELALELSRLDDARASLEPIAALTETMRNERGLVRGQLLFGQMAMQQDDLEDALTYFRRAASTARGLNDPDLLARSLLALAGWHERYGDTTASKRHLEGAMNLFNRWGTYRMDLRSRSLMLQRAIHMWADRGMLQRADRLSADLSRLAEVTELAPVECRAEWARAKVLSASGEHTQALAMLEAAERNAHRYGLTALRIELIREKATAAVDAGQYEKAIEVARQLITLAGYAEDLYSQQRGRDVEAAASCALGQNADASLRHLEQSLERAQSRGLPRDIYLSHLNLERAFEALGREDLAASHRQEAQRIGHSMRYTVAA
jgi:serine/threonine protein kinase/tetratricopeptide (TPR) repeat protein